MGYLVLGLDLHCDLDPDDADDQEGRRQAEFADLLRYQRELLLQRTRVLSNQLGLLADLGVVAHRNHETLCGAFVDSGPRDEDCTATFRFRLCLSAPVVQHVEDSTLDNQI